MTRSAGRANWDWAFFGIVSFFFLWVCLLLGLFGDPKQAPLHLGALTLVSGRFIVLYMLCWACFMLIFLVYPQGKQPKHHAWVILLLSATAHLSLLGFPASDDVNRYLWEGYLLVKGISPYHHPPNDPALSVLAQGFAHFQGINHPEIPAAYPPVMLSLFSFLGLISLNPMIVKLAMMTLNVLAVYLLMRYLKQRNLDLRWALLYAINPLVLVSFAGEGHGDVLQTVFLLGALCLYHGKRPALMFVCLGFAVQSKLVAILAVPFFVTRENCRFIPLFIITVVFPYLLFLKDGWPGLFNGLFIFGKDFAFNGPVQSLLETVGVGRDLTRMVCAMLFGLVYLGNVALFRSGGLKNLDNTPVSGCLAVFGALIVFSPTVHAWYICWVLPLAVIRFKRSWLVLSLVACFYYVAPGMVHLKQAWHLPGWALGAQWLPFGVLLLVEGVFFLVRSFQRIGTPPVQSVSVVVPAMNEEAAIGECIRHILANPDVTEVIVVDGGSKDNTQDAARQAGARVLKHAHPPDQGGGRGGQARQGIMNARGDVVAVVHADTRVGENAFGDLISFMNHNPHISGGALGTVFDHVSFRMKIIECLNTLRATFFSISFGDQIQFFRRRPVVERNCFPDLPLMEDVEFSLQLLALGRTAYLFGDSRVSSRRWQKKGLANAGTVLRYFFAYLAVRPFKKPDTVSMYRRYYGK